MTNEGTEKNEYLIENITTLLGSVDIHNILLQHSEYEEPVHTFSIS